MKLSNNFSRSEFKCKCNECDSDTIDAGVVKILQEIRDSFNAIVTVTSGLRCVAYNERVGGSFASQHIRGRAADIIVHGVDPDDVANWIDTVYPDSLGLGRYSTFTHIDTRNEKARW